MGTIVGVLTCIVGLREAYMALSAEPVKPKGLIIGVGVILFGLWVYKKARKAPG